MEKQKVAIVASKNVHERLSTIFKEAWDTLYPITSVDSFWDKWDEDPNIHDISIFVTMDSFYNSTDPEKVEFYINTLVNLATSGTVMVTVVDTGSGEKVKKAFNAVVREDPDAKGEIYLISPSQTGRSFKAAAEEFNRRGMLNSGAAANIVGEIGDVDISHEGMVFTVTSAKGGVGKSTVSQLLAAQLGLGGSRDGVPLKVAIVDLDTYDSQLGFVINKMRPTSLNIKATGDIGPKTIMANMIKSEMFGSYCLLAPIRGNNAPDVDAAFYTPVINNMRAMFDYIIIDTSVQYHDELVPTALRISDGIIYVTDQDIKSIGGMSRWMQHVTSPEENGGYAIPKDKIGLVINKALSADVNMSTEKIHRANNGARILGVIPANIGEFVGATNNYSMTRLLYDIPNISGAYEIFAKNIIGPSADIASLYKGDS